MALMKTWGVVEALHGVRREGGKKTVCFKRQKKKKGGKQSIQKDTFIIKKTQNANY